MKRKTLGLELLVLVCILIYSSCTKIDTTDIGNDLIPVVDNVNTFDTIIDVITDNKLFDDSTRISTSEDHALGVIQNDPIFGKLTASIYSDFELATFGTKPFYVKDSIKSVDSVILSYGFKGIYGDSLTTQRFNVYEISTSANFDDSAVGYRISDAPPALGPLLKTHDQDLDRLSDEYKVVNGRDTVTVKNQMRIRLDKSFADRFINYDTAVYGSDSAFKRAFKGIALVPQAGAGTQNALAYFNIADNANTKITIHYKANVGATVDSPLVTNFVFVNSARNFNSVKRDIAGTEFQTAINSASTQDDKVYLATSPGSYATIRVPGLSGMSNRVIHRAELIAEKITTPNENIYTTPYYVFLDALDSAAGLPRTIQNDFIYSSNQFNLTQFGGFIDKNKYTFNLTRYVQGIVTRKETSFTLRMYAPLSTYTAYVPEGQGVGYTPDYVKTLFANQVSQFFLPLYLNRQVANGRVIVGGGNHPTQKMKLRIIYSKI